jgi:cytochrome c5
LKRIKIALIFFTILLAIIFSIDFGDHAQAQIRRPKGLKQQAKQLLQPAPSANIDPAIADFGKHILADETFGNEVFWTQIAGLLNGNVEVNGQPVSVLSLVLQSIDNLDGVSGNLFNGNGNAFTENLVINIPENTTIDNGAIKLPAGPFALGLAVPKGGALPLGIVPAQVAAGTPGAANPHAINAGYPDQNFIFGVSCSLCHERVLSDGSRLPGFANTQLQVGAIFALAANSAALFPIGGALPQDPDPFKPGQPAFDADGDGIVDADKAEDFERMIDEEFLLTPKGYFDVTLDGRTNPTQTPINATNGNQPLLWDGFFAPNKEGNTDNFVHTVLLDVTSLAALADTPAADVFPYLKKGGDAYLANLMARSPAAMAGKSFADIDPQPDVPGILARARAVSPLSKDSITGVRAFLPNPGIAGLSDDNAAEEAVDAAMESFNGMPNSSKENRDALKSGSVLRGAKVFLEAQCDSCHAAPFFSSNIITPLDTIGTEPTRAQDSAPFKALAGMLGLNGIVGYKTQAKRFLFATAPYLHDGGVAAARSRPNGPIDIFGVVATLYAGIDPEPRASLAALLDPAIRAKVVDANRTQAIPASRVGKKPADIAITGQGHDFFVAAGMPRQDGKGAFKQRDQDDLINFLLALDDDPGK